MYFDPRGLRFGATLTTVVLAIALVTQSVWVIGFQAIVFAIGAIVGLKAAPYGLIFKSLVRPRLSAPVELEAEAPPRFAQVVGLIFALVATIGFASGAAVVGIVATAIALAAAFLNAAFGFCLGCEVFLIIRRITGGSTERLVPMGGATN
jgi:hypothetical protein